MDEEGQLGFQGFGWIVLGRAGQISSSFQNRERFQWPGQTIPVGG